MRGGLEPPLTVGASQVSQRTSLLKPAIHAHLDVTVDVPAQGTIVIVRKCNMVNRKYQLFHVFNESFPLNVKIWGFITEFVVDLEFKLNAI